MSDNSNRIPLYEKHGYDVKMSYHTLRLLIFFISFLLMVILILCVIKKNVKL